MKILYVCTTTDRGGAETALHRLALAAQQAGHTVKVISLKPLGRVAAAMQQDGLTVISLDLLGKFKPVQMAGALARLVGEIQNFAPDVVHAFLYRAIQFTRMAKRRAVFKLVTSPHYDLSKQNYAMRLWDRSLKEADDISGAESEQTFLFLRDKQRYDASKLQLVCNGVDVNYFSPNAYERKQVRERLGLTDQHRVFCCVARLAKEKNQELLLQSAAAVYAKNPFLRVILVGDGPENANLRHFSQNKGLEKAVLFVGEQNDVRPYLWASDIFVLPSLVESLPLALLEAGACGLPAIVSKVGDMPRIVEHGKTGFVFNGKDPILLSVLMAELAENRDLAAQMGRAARSKIEQKYPAPEQIYIKLYEQFSRENKE